MDLYNLRYLPLAKLDLFEIDAYLSKHSLSKAKSFIEELNNKCKALQLMPFMYPYYRDSPIYRVMIVMEYLVFYIADEKLSQIDIHRIIYGGMDISKQII